MDQETRDLVKRIRDSLDRHMALCELNYGAENPPDDDDDDEGGDDDDDDRRSDPLVSLQRIRAYTDGVDLKSITDYNVRHAIEELRKL